MIDKQSNKGMYMISIVSRMLEVHPQTLRMYEREGFICPHRNNNQRLYSDKDIETLNLIVDLIKNLGVNKAGVDIILRMRNHINIMQQELLDMTQYLEDDIKKIFEARLKKIFEK